MPRARILIVDDQRFQRTLLEDQLSHAGYEAVAVDGGVDAMHRLEHETFDLVLTDLAMPGMDGTALLRGVKTRFPDLEVIVITGVDDVRTAVETLKLGASDYLLKPVDRDVLVRAVESLLDRRRLQREHQRLLAENLEFLGAMSLQERARTFLSTTSVEPLAERIGEAMCLETSAQGALLWLAEDEGGHLSLRGAVGVVRTDDQPERILLSRLPTTLAPLVDPETRSLLAPADAAFGTAAGDPALWIPLVGGSSLLGVVRLTDPVDGGEFEDRARIVAERLGDTAAVAVSNALRFANLERRAFKDPTTKAYTRNYLEDAIRNEIHRASRFGRGFSLVRLRLEPLAPLRDRMSEPELGSWLEQVVVESSRVLRSTDVIAAESESRYCMLLSETNGLGAAVLKRRLREALEGGEAFAALPPAERPRLLLASACFPEDGGQLQLLDAALEAGIEQERESLVRSLDLASESFAGTVDALLQRARPQRREMPNQIVRFLFDEIGRRSQQAGLCLVSPGNLLGDAVAAGLESLARRAAPLTEVVVLSDTGAGAAPAGVTHVPVRRAGTRAPFAIFYGAGPAYAVVCEPESEPGQTPLFHTHDRMLVEHLAFQLQRDLGIAVSA